MAAVPGEHASQAAIAADPLEREIDTRGVPLRALYEHWERNRWSVSQVDYTADRAAFEALAPDDQERLRWLFVHRFDGESLVARLLSPFLTAARRASSSACSSRRSTSSRLAT